VESETPLFVWKDWQKAIECRRAVLSTFHFPTREQLEPESTFDLDAAVSALEHSHCDPFLTERYHFQRKSCHIRNHINRLVKRIY